MKLEEMKPDTRANYILWELALALGYVRTGEKKVAIDPDELLEEALDTIWKYNDLNR